MFLTTETVVFWLANVAAGAEGGAQRGAGPSESQLDGPTGRPARRQARAAVRSGAAQPEVRGHLDEPEQHESRECCESEPRRPEPEPLPRILPRDESAAYCYNGDCRIPSDQERGLERYFESEQACEQGFDCEFEPAIGEETSCETRRGLGRLERGPDLGRRRRHDAGFDALSHGAGGGCDGGVPE